MSIVRVGTNQKYANGWESIFGNKKGAAKKPAVAAKKTKKKSSGRKK